MKAECFYCKKVTDVEPYSQLCVDCLILRSQELKSMRLSQSLGPKPMEPTPFDPRKAAANDE